MKRVCNKAKNFKKAEEYDILQNLRIAINYILFIIIICIFPKFPGRKITWKNNFFSLAFKEVFSCQDFNRSYL